MNTQETENYNRLRYIIQTQFGFTLPDSTKARSSRIKNFLSDLAESKTATSKREYEKTVIISAVKSEALPLKIAVQNLLKGYQNKPIAKIISELRELDKLSNAT